jgi:hypothetical protein
MRTLNETTKKERKRLGRAGHKGNYWISLIRLEGRGCLQVNRLQPSVISSLQSRLNRDGGYGSLVRVRAITLDQPITRAIIRLA